MVRFEAYGHAPYPPDEPILFVFRESSERAESHLLSLAAGVLSRHAHRAEARALLEAKLGPFHEPERWDGQWIPLTHGRATLVRIGQVYALYALSSASMDNEGEGEDNSFTLALDDVIRGIRPYAVITGPFSRICRSAKHMAVPLKAFLKTRAILECNERRLDFRYRDAESQFVELAHAAQSERTLSVARLENGARNGMAAGEFRFSRTQLPDGYAKVNRRIALGAPAQVQTIQRAFLLLAQPDAKVRSVGAYVQSTKAFEPRRRRNRDVDNSGPLGADSADALVRRLIQYVDAYQSATWVVRRTPALPLVVARDEDGDVENGSREEFWFPLPIPDGGWASDETFARVRANSASESLEGNRPGTSSPDMHEKSAPLTGFVWHSDGQETALRTVPGSPKQYQLLQRPATSAAANDGVGSSSWSGSMRRGWDRRITGGLVVCRFLAEDLHISIADAFGTMDPVLVRQVDRAIAHESHAEQAGVDIGAAELTSIADEIGRAKRRRDAASNTFYDSKPDDPMRDDYDADFRKWAGVVKRLEATMQHAKAVPSPAPQAWNAGAGTVLAVLARLRTTAGPMPAAVVKSLHRVLSGFTVTFDEKTNTITWRAGLLVPDLTNKRDREIGPLQGTIPVRNRESRDHGRMAVRARDALLAGECDVETSEWTALTTEMATFGVGSVAMGALVDAPEPVRRGVLAVAWREVASTNASLASFARMAGQAYTHDGRGQLAWNEPGRIRQPLLDHLAAEGPTNIRDLPTVGFASARAMHEAIRTPSGTWLPCAVFDRVFEGASKDGGQRVLAFCRPCPHCGGKVDMVVRTRECASGLLCSACLRMPILGSEVFPRDYRDLALRPQARRGLIDPPDWWNGLARAVDERPDANVTVLARMLKRRRWEIQVGADALQMAIANAGEVSEAWTAERLRQEYVVKGRRLVDLADELGVSVGTLTKTLRKHELYR